MNKSQIPEKSKKYLIWAVLLIAFLIRVINIGAFDMTTDGAHYGFRALGWFDYLGSSTQTTPIQWFGNIPWWANLSFHDAPPLFFLIQKIFFTFFGSSTAVLRLPGLLSGILITWIIYYLVKKRKDENTALIAAFIFAISSAAVWVALGEYIESVEMVFIVASVYTLSQYLENFKSKWLYLFSLFLGLSLLSKYTAIFLIPAALAAIFIRNKGIFSKQWKSFLVSIGIVLIVLLPVIIYNTEVFRTRGHFDAALSSMVGMHPKDFELIASRSSNLSSSHFFDNITSVWSSLMNTNSIFLILLFLASFVYIIYKMIKKKSSDLELIVFTNIFFMILMFCFSGGAERYLVIISPFVAIAVAIFAVEIYELLKKKGTLPTAWIILVCIFIAGEMFYSINTNLLEVPFGESFYFYSPVRFYDTGMDQVEDFLQTTFSPLPAIKRPANLQEIGGNISGQSIVFYDDRIDWFRYMWYFAKYQFYYKVPLLPLTYLLDQKNPGQYLESLEKNFPGDIYFVYITPNGPLDSVLSKNQNLNNAINSIAQGFDIQKAPVQNIKDPHGNITLKIYKLK